MTVAVGGHTTDKDDPLYRKGIGHLQAGEWQEAIRSFEELARKYPDSQPIRRALEEAQFKALIDAKSRVRAKRWIIPWRPAIFRILVVLTIAVLAVQGVRLISERAAPLLAQAQMERQRAQLLVEANGYLEGGDLDAAEARFKELLAQVPDHPEAQEGLRRVAEEREILALYQEAVALQEKGDYQGALTKYSELSVKRAGYRDVSLRVKAIQHQQEVARLYEEAEAAYAAGLALDAVAKYQQLKELDVSFKPDVVDARLYELYMRLGRGLILQNPPVTDDVQQAVGYFTKALALQPRSAEATLEQRLALLYLEGQTRYHEGRWDEAIARLRAVYDQRPDYLSGTVANLLYDAYIRSGDRHQEAGDLYLAYELYRQAVELPVTDKALARGRMFSIAPRLTPTATPTVTPTTTPTPLPTPTTPPTPTPTPMRLQDYRNMIVFYSSDENQPGLWVMDPTGKNRQYLGGETRDRRKEYEALIQKAQFSPDGRFRAFVQNAGRTPQIFLALPADQFGQPPPRQLTHFSAVSYDPVWSPDGSRIAFVSQEKGSDDIWVIYPDGTGARQLTENTWEWDKHPSWSPDSKRIVFWSNRTGVKQIYVMDADGRNVRNISNTEWDEYDPIWIR